MKSTGIVRRIDVLGRICLPKELRNTLGIADLDPLEVFVDGDRIIIQKYAPGCVFCHSTENLNTIWDRNICTSCAKRIAGYGFNERT